MSNVLLEGAATGRTLITSNIPGCREAVEDGVSGYLCQAQNTEDLTNAMRTFVRKPFDERKQMGLYGRELVQQHFDKKVVVSQTIIGLNLVETAPQEV